MCTICICIYSLGLLVWSSNFCAQRQRIINKLLSVNVTRATSLDQINQDADGFIKRQQHSTWPRANRSWSWPIPTVIFTHYQSTSNSYWRASSIAGQAAAAPTGTHGRDTKPLEWEYERERVCLRRSGNSCTITALDGQIALELVILIYRALIVCVCAVLFFLWISLCCASSSLSTLLWNESAASVFAFPLTRVFVLLNELHLLLCLVQEHGCEWANARTARWHCPQGH